MVAAPMVAPRKIGGVNGVTPPPGLFPSDDNESSDGFGAGTDGAGGAEAKDAPGSRRYRKALIAIAVFAVLVAVGVAGFRWYSESYVERPGGLGESAARAACEDAVRIESGYGDNAVFDTWSATIVPGDGSDNGPDNGSDNGANDADQWLVEGQVFAEAERGVDETDGSRTDGEEFSCTVGEDDAVVMMR